MLTEKTFRPAGGGKCQCGIATVQVGDPLEVIADYDRPGNYVVTEASGEPVGFLSARHWVSVDLANDRIVLHASVNGIGSDQGGNDTITVRIVTGDTGDTFEMPAAVTRTYSVGLVGESHYQTAIRRCGPGDPVSLVHEPTNRFDNRAIAAKVMGQVIGYLPRDGWATAVLLDERKNIDGRIASIEQSGGGMLGVVVTVSIGAIMPAQSSSQTAVVRATTFSPTTVTATAEAVATASAAAAPPAPKRPGFFARLLGI